MGVVVMDYGSPSAPEQLRDYLTDIRRGRPPEPALLEDLADRYAAIGGLSALNARSAAQRARLQDLLDAARPGGFVVVEGHKHTHPSIEEGVSEVARRSLHLAVGLVLAPHWSAASVGQYLARAEAEASRRSLGWTAVDDWSLEPAYLDFLAAQVRAGLAGSPPRTRVVFTAHSLPERAVADGDPYVARLEGTAEAVAAQVGLDEGAWQVAWQSAGRTADTWLGPDILDVLRATAARGDVDGVLVCPAGFTSDHLEVAYDLDVQAAGVAAEVGLAFARTATVDDDRAVLGALAARIVALADGWGPRP